MNGITNFIIKFCSLSLLKEKKEKESNAEKKKKKKKNIPLSRTLYEKKRL